MSLFSALPNRLCEWFSDMNEFADYSFCTQYPSGSKSTPLTKPIVVFGTKCFQVLETETDESGTVITDSRSIQEQFSIGIHVPRTMGGSACNEILDRITDLLLFDTPLSVVSVVSQEQQFVRNTDSLYMSVTFTVSETIEKGTDYPTELDIS